MSLLNEACDSRTQQKNADLLPKYFDVIYSPLCTIDSSGCYANSNNVQCFLDTAAESGYMEVR